MENVSQHVRACVLAWLKHYCLLKTFTLDCIALHCTTLRCCAPHTHTLHYVVAIFLTSLGITGHHATLHYIRLHCITLHYTPIPYPAQSQMKNCAPRSRWYTWWIMQHTDPKQCMTWNMSQHSMSGLQHKHLACTTRETWQMFWHMVRWYMLCGMPGMLYHVTIYGIRKIQCWWWT